VDKRAPLLIALARWLLRFREILNNTLTWQQPYLVNES
jgi:hypothetical protein